MSEELARRALAELTPDHTVGAYLGSRDEAEHVVSHLWASAQPGYPDWQWTVTVVSLPDAAPSVMELGLLPTETSVLSPEWIPWSQRLAEYRAAQKAAAEARAAAGEDAELVDEFVPDDELDVAQTDEDGDSDADEDSDSDDDDADSDDEDEESDDAYDEGDELDDDVDDALDQTELIEEEDLDEFGAADDDDIHGVTLPGEED